MVPPFTSYTGHLLVPAVTVAVIGVTAWLARDPPTAATAEHGLRWFGTRRAGAPDPADTLRSRAEVDVIDDILAWLCFFGQFVLTLAWTRQAGASAGVRAFSALHVLGALVALLALIDTQCNMLVGELLGVASTCRSCCSSPAQPGRCHSRGRSDSNAARFAVDSPRERRHSHSLRIAVEKPSSKIVLKDSSA